MKKCKKCDLIFEDSGNYCLQCGKKLVTFKEDVAEKFEVINEIKDENQQEANREAHEEIKTEVEQEIKEKLQEEIGTELQDEIEAEVQQEMNDIKAKSKKTTRKVPFFKKKKFAVFILIILLGVISLFASIIRDSFFSNKENIEKDIILQIEENLSIEYDYINPSDSKELKDLKSQLYDQVLLKSGFRDKDVLNDLNLKSALLRERIIDIDKNYIFDKDLISSAEKNLELDNYFFEDETKYKNLKDELEEQKKLEVGKREKNKLIEIYNSSIELNKEVVDENMRLVDEYTASIEETLEMSNFAEESLTEINEYDVKYKNYLEKNNYALAIATLKEFGEFLDASSKIPEDYDIVVKQINYVDYPSVKLYLKVIDKETEKPAEGLDAEFFYIKEKDENEKEKEIKSIGQLKYLEKSKFSIIMDISKSMQNESFEIAKSTVNDFINFLGNDNSVLITFSEFVYELKGFQSSEIAKYEDVLEESELELSALYNAIYWGVEATIHQEGPKAVIVYTDGKDNASSVTSKEVIHFANANNVSVFIIGIGNEYDENELKKIADETGGEFYKNKKMSDVKDIYNSIYNDINDLFVLTYETDANKGDEVNAEVGYIYKDAEEKTTTGGMAEISYTP